MVEPPHFLNNQDYQFKTDMTSYFDDQITWGLPRSSQPLLGTVPGSNLDSPRDGLQHASILEILK